MDETRPVSHEHRTGRVGPRIWNNEGTRAPQVARVAPPAELGSPAVRLATRSTSSGGDQWVRAEHDDNRIFGRRDDEGHRSTLKVYARPTEPIV